MTRTALLTALLLGLSLGAAAPARAKDVNITEFLPEVTFFAQGKKYTIERVQDPEHALTGGFAKTSRKCPPFCVHPMQIVPGVATVGELELLEFVKNKLEKGNGLLIDARTPSWFEKGTIPGSINVPFTVFDLKETDAELVKTLELLGVRKGQSVNYADAEHRATDELGEAKRAFPYDFSRAKDVLLFCNGPWCDQSPRAIRALVKLGYPTNKIYYYRGGMQVWLLLGFNAYVPEPKPVKTAEKR